MKTIILTKEITKLFLTKIGYDPKGIINTSRTFSEPAVDIVWKDRKERKMVIYNKLPLVYKKRFLYNDIEVVIKQDMFEKKLNRILDFIE